MPQNIQETKFPLSFMFSEMKMLLLFCTTLRAKNLLNSARSYVVNNFN